MEKQRCDERRNRRIGVEMEKTTGSQTQSLTEEMKVFFFFCFFFFDGKEMKGYGWVSRFFTYFLKKI